MGKKIGIGCLVVALVVIVGGGYFAYSSFVKPLMSSVSVLEDISEANKQIRNKSSYSPPSNKEITPGQVDRFVQVQKSIRENLENRFSEFQQKYEELAEQLDGREPRISDLSGAYSDLIQMYSDAKEFQVNALNDQGFSLEEYRYVQLSFYQALGVELFSFDIDQIAAAASQGDFNIDMDEFRNLQSQMDEVPQSNRELVSTYKDDADTWLIFGWWGL